MDLRLIKRLNELWQPIYPYLAAWMARWCPGPKGTILEMGPFSGGIACSLRRRVPHLGAVCVVRKTGVAEIIKTSFQSRVAIVVSDLERPPFRCTFEFIVFRGAFFFLDPPILRHIYQTLGEGGRALLGGGYGPLTPPEAIAKISEESRDLNFRLGKKVVARQELADMIGIAGLKSSSTIIEEGGLWVLLSKPG